MYNLCVFQLINGIFEHKQFTCYIYFIKQSRKLRTRKLIMHINVDTCKKRGERVKLGISEFTIRLPRPATGRRKGRVIW